MKKIVTFFLVTTMLASYGCAPDKPITPPDTTESPETTIAPETTAMPETTKEPETTSAPDTSTDTDKADPAVLSTPKPKKNDDGTYLISVEKDELLQVVASYGFSDHPGYYRNTDEGVQIYNVGTDKSYYRVFAHTKKSDKTAENAVLLTYKFVCKDGAIQNCELVPTVTKEEVLANGKPFDGVLDEKYNCWDWRRTYTFTFEDDLMLYTTFVQGSDAGGTYTGKYKYNKDTGTLFASLSLDEYNTILNGKLYEYGDFLYFISEPQTENSISAGSTYPLVFSNTDDRTRHSFTFPEGSVSFTTKKEWTKNVDYITESFPDVEVLERVFVSRVPISEADFNEKYANYRTVDLHSGGKAYYQSEFYKEQTSTGQRTLEATVYEFHIFFEGMDFTVKIKTYPEFDEGEQLFSTVFPLICSVSIKHTLYTHSWYAAYRNGDDVRHFYLDLSPSDGKITFIESIVAQRKVNEYTGIFTELDNGIFSAIFGEKEIRFKVEDDNRSGTKYITLTRCDIEEYRYLLDQKLTFESGATIPDTAPSKETKEFEAELYEIDNVLISQDLPREKLAAPITVKVNIPVTWKRTSNIIFEDTVRMEKGFDLYKRAEISPLLYKIPDDMEWNESTIERLTLLFAGHKATPFITTSGYNAVEYSANHFQNLPDSKYVYYQYLIQISDEYAVHLTLMMFDMTDKGTVDPRDIANSIVVVK